MDLWVAAAAGLATGFIGFATAARPGSASTVGGMVDTSAGVLDPEFVRAAVTDPGRLAELRDTGLLDTLPEEPFDRITRLAARMVGVDTAFVSLVDRDRQFFKSQVGLPPEWAAERETPLTHSFCQYAVASRERFIVEDARSHPQVAENPAVEEGVVAYAGETLETSSGHVLGTLCVAASEPREWTSDELDVLAELAALALTEIEYRLRTRALQRIEATVETTEGAAAEVSDAVSRLVGEAERSEDPVVGRLATAARTRMRILEAGIDELREVVRWRPDLVEPVHRPSRLGDRVLRAAQTASASVPDRSLQSDLRDRPLVASCDALGVERALTNLLVAAMQHAEPDTAVEVTMGRVGEDIDFHLDSEGRPMPVSELSRLVGQLYRALQDPAGPTVEASLQASGRTVKITHGTIRATTGLAGTYLSFTVPYVPGQR